jgi:hypothetical protein
MSASPFVRQGDPFAGSQPSSSHKRKFTPEEDNFLAYLVRLHGPNNWRAVASQMRGRTVRQCRERWKYYLEPSINKGDWTEAEDQLLVVKYHEIGPKWAQIAAFFASRTDIDLKNRFQRIQRVMKKADHSPAQPPADPPTIFPLLLPDRGAMTILQPVSRSLAQDFDKSEGAKG